MKMRVHCSKVLKAKPKAKEKPASRKRAREAEEREVTETGQNAQVAKRIAPRLPLGFPQGPSPEKGKPKGACVHCLGDPFVVALH